METVTKSPQAGRSTDRVLEALSTLSALIDRTINEVKTLDSDFQKRVLQAVHETEASLQGQASDHLEKALSEAKTKLEAHFAKKIEEMSAQWEEERKRLNAELNKMTQTTAQWETERTRLSGEVERLTKLQAKTQVEAENANMAIISMRASAAPKSAKPAVNAEALSVEIQRVEGLVKTISVLIEDPVTELSTVIRKNVERAELESYLKGIRYAIDGGKTK